MPAFFKYAGVFWAVAPSGLSAEYCWANAMQETASKHEKIDDRRKSITIQDTPSLRQRLQLHRLAGLCGFTRGIENLHDDHVRVECG